MAFLTPPTAHWRDGIRLETVTAANPTGVFPDGPRPWIATHQWTNATDYANLASCGFTMIAGRDGNIPTLSNIHSAGAVGLKFMFPMRDHELPFNDGHMGDRQFQAEAWIKRDSNPQMLRDLVKVRKDAVDFIVNDPEPDPKLNANNVVIGWHYNYDDSLGHNNTWPPKDYRDSAEYIMKIIYAYDPKHRYAGDCPPWGGTPMSKLQIMESIDGGKTRSQYYHGWLIEAGLWSWQHFYSYSLNPENTGKGGGRTGQFENANRAMRLNHLTMTERQESGKPRIIAPLMYVDKHNKKYNVPEFRNYDFVTKHYISLMAIRLTADNTGISFYKYLLRYTLSYVETFPGSDVWIDDHTVSYAEGYETLKRIRETVKLLNDANIFKAILWGVSKGGTLNDIAKRDKSINVGDGYPTVAGDTRKIALDSGLAKAYGTSRCSNMNQGGIHDYNYAPYNIPPIGDDCTDNEGGNLGGSSRNRTIDPILWITKQYKNKRYLVVTNTQQHPDEVKHWNETPPTRYNFRSKFILPTIDTSTVRCTDIITGNAVTIQHDSSGYFVRVDLAPIETAILVFEDTPTIVPTVSTATPTSITKEIGDTQTFSAIVTGDFGPGSGHKWQVRDKGERLETDWRDI